MADAKSISDDNDEKNKKLAKLESESETNVVNKKGMVLPFKPLSLVFDHVNYYVDMPAVSILSVENESRTVHSKCQK